MRLNYVNARKLLWRTTILPRIKKGNRAELANIRCPDKFKFNSKILKTYSGTLKVRPPCVFTTPKFSLPTIQTKRKICQGFQLKFCL